MGAVGEGDAAGVEDPEAVFGVDDDGLDSDDVFLVVGSGRRGGGMDEGTTWRGVDLSVGIGGLSVVGVEFCNLIASVGMVEAERIV